MTISKFPTKTKQTQKTTPRSLKPSRGRKSWDKKGTYRPPSCVHVYPGRRKDMHIEGIRNALLLGIYVFLRIMSRVIGGLWMIYATAISTLCSIRILSPLALRLRVLLRLAMNLGFYGIQDDSVAGFPDPSFRGHALWLLLPGGGDRLFIYLLFVICGKIKCAESRGEVRCPHAEALPQDHRLLTNSKSPPHLRDHPVPRGHL